MGQGLRAAKIKKGVTHVSLLRNDGVIQQTGRTTLYDGHAMAAGEAVSGERFQRSFMRAQRAAPMHHQRSAFTGHFRDTIQTELAAHSGQAPFILRLHLIPS